MFRLLLVDDEPTVRKGMISRFDWKKCETAVVGSAANGAQALDLALELKPHIILTDIKMPVMDGVELARQIREKLPECKIIVMSGYDDFTYAKSLMSLKVTEYLLKPVDEKELTNAITRMVREVKEYEIRKASRHEADRLLKENLPQLKAKFMQKILKGAFSSDDEFVKRAATLDLHICEKSREYRIITIAIDTAYLGQSASDERELELVNYSVTNISEELINEAASGFLSYNGAQELIGLICTDGNCSFDPDQLSQNIHYHLKKYLDISSYIGIGVPVLKIGDIRESYDDAVSALSEKRYSGKRNYVQIVLRHVEENFNTDISLAEAAQLVFVSPNYLSRIFKEEMKMSFVDWLNQLRVQKAKEMLLHTNLKTYEVAEQVGYKNYKYFSAIFKKNTGVLPSEYRRRPPL